MAKYAPNGQRRTCKADQNTIKIDEVIALLERTVGATLDEMTETTGLLPHTTRAGEARGQHPRCTARRHGEVTQPAGWSRVR